MAGPSCHNCVYSVCDPEMWLRLIWTGEPVVPRCANHPQWPGELHDVPGVPCRNYRPKPVLPEGDSVRLIPLGDGHYAYVDAADYEELSKYTWHLNNGYAARREKGRVIYMHRQIMQAPEDMVVDHYDGNKTNNCRVSLRICTPAENHRNQRKRHGARSRYIGVFYSKQHHKWFARCVVGGHRHWLGYFKAEVDAARAYDRMAVELFPEFARVNFPAEWPPERRAEVHALFQAQNGGQESKKTKGRNKKSRAEPPGRREGKRGTKARRPEAKKVRAASKVAPGTKKSRPRDAHHAKSKSRKPRAETPRRRAFRQKMDKKDLRNP